MIGVSTDASGASLCMTQLEDKTAWQRTQKYKTQLEDRTAWQRTTRLHGRDGGQDYMVDVEDMTT